MLSKDDFIEELTQETKVINQASDIDVDAPILNYVCEEVADRISLYLNLQEPEIYDDRLVKIGSRIASGIFTQTKANIAGTSVDTSIKSLSDNGQSITYGDATRNYLATVSDGELFGGCAELLKPYRRLNVVSRKC